ncbi:uncharacterized protein [Venturia canescens]|uniref:uncharacterized protein isoform X3 n=1 Tax=Venturia canescens TaxID=32260 RepID=UPI001C9D656A|nr:uncharacterized protein LOC122410628 isoform X3 [Venturia canescens]
MALRMIASTRLTLLPVFFVSLVLCIGVTHAIRCYKCGQYNDGVGSITPCINYTAYMHLEECPPASEWCIKYVSEGSTVRDCVPTCVEKEVWSTRTYCCQEEGCNSGPSMRSTSNVLWAFGISTISIILGSSALRG